MRNFLAADAACETNTIAGPGEKLVCTSSSPLAMPWPTLPRRARPRRAPSPDRFDLEPPESRPEISDANQIASHRREIAKRGGIDHRGEE